MGNYTIFQMFEILGEAGKQEMLQKCSENSTSEIVFRTDIFRKLTLGAPVISLGYSEDLPIDLGEWVCTGET